MISKSPDNCSHIVLRIPAFPMRIAAASAWLMASVFLGGLAVCQLSSAQSGQSQIMSHVTQNQGVAFTKVFRYEGKTEDAMAATTAGTTIPMASFSFTAAKDKLTYTDTIVGTNPFAATKTTTTINVLIVPVIVTIGSTAFDPTAVDACITPNMSPLAALQQSPLLKPVVFDGGAAPGHAATMNGVNVGTTIYPDAFRRAEFWSNVGGSNYHIALNVKTATPWIISAAEVQNLGGGVVVTTACADIGILNSANFENYVQNTMIPGIAAITPTTFPLFLLKDVVTSSASPLSCRNGCTIGYHSAFGSPVQTYGVAEYDTTQKFWTQSGNKNIAIIAHEIGEWLDDPLGTNGTPAWGASGQVSGCQNNWEVGDPLTGTDFPAIIMPNGVNYSPQELVFWGWYYDAETTASIGAGGRFSSDRTFARPSKVCPPGGTF